MAIKKCKECGKEVSTSAKFCPHCGKKYPVGGWTLPAKIGLVIFVLWAVGYMFGNNHDSSNSSSSQATVSQSAQVVSIETLLGQYKDNEVRADGLFKGVVIQTTGIVDDVKKDITDSMYVTIGTGRQFEIPQLQCFFNDTAAASLARLNKGTKITVKGVVKGLMFNVLVKECVLVPS
jgi:hypothetical protein